MHIVSWIIKYLRKKHSSSNSQSCSLVSHLEKKMTVDVNSDTSILKGVGLNWVGLFKEKSDRHREEEVRQKERTPGSASRGQGSLDC